MNLPCPRHAVRTLVDAGWTEARIGAACGTSQSTIHRLKRNKQRFVSFELGSALIALAGLQRAQHGPADGGGRDAAARQWGRQLGHHDGGDGDRNRLACGDRVHERNIGAAEIRLSRAEGRDECVVLVADQVG